MSKKRAARINQAGEPPLPGHRFVYFLRSGEYVKIGQSRRWKVRMSNMQIGSPFTIVPLLVLIADPALERQLHSNFGADHFRGEWFHLGPAVRHFIKENLKNCVAKSGPDIIPEEEFTL